MCACNRYAEHLAAFFATSPQPRCETPRELHLRFRGWSLHQGMLQSIEEHQGIMKNGSGSYECFDEFFMKLFVNFFWGVWVVSWQIIWRVYLFRILFCFFLRIFFSVWGSFPCYLLHFGAKISDLHAICCILEWKSLICFWLLAFGFCFLLLDFWLLAFGFRLLAFGFGFGFWLLAGF